MRLARLLARFAAPLLAGVLPHALHAQRVRVEVDRSGGPVPSDLTAALLTDAGERVAPRLVPASGRVELAAPAEGTYRVALYRVGFARVASAPVRLTAGAEAVTLRLAPPRAAVALAGVEVVGASTCGRRPEAGGAALLWEEVRKALDASALAVDAGELEAATTEFRRERAPGGGPDGGRVRHERRTEGWARVRQPYVTPPPGELLRNGFVRVAGETLEAYAPDARLLLDPRFHATYCFGVRTADAPSPGLVGLTFAPAAPRAGLTGVRGVLWVDRASAELRSLTWDYVGLPARWAGLTGPLAGAGGQVDYARLPSGLWVVRAWRLHVPRPGARPVDPLAPELRYTVAGVWEAGGELLDAVRLNGADASAAPGRARPTSREVVTVAATVLVRDAAGRPLAGATVAVDSGAAAPTDSAGRVVLDRLLAGPRRVRVEAPGRTPFDSVFAVPSLPDVTLTVALDSAGAPATADTLVARLAGAVRDSARAAAGRRATLAAASPLAGFERRRRSGLGTYLTREQLLRRNPRTVPEALRGVVGLLIDERGVRALRPGFGMKDGSNQETGCYPAVFVDGTRTPPFISPFGALVPDELAAVEWYRGVGMTPPEFTGSGGTDEGAGCGALAVWTQRGDAETASAPARSRAPRSGR